MKSVICIFEELNVSTIKLMFGHKITAGNILFAGRGPELICT